MKRRSGRESGFALLLVFAMASIIAITLFYAMPRVAFEAERDKEQLLIDRGEQYTRAIQLYVRKTKRFPAKMEDLENTNGIRFLRRQYVDPMTGKSEWRVIHAGPGGVLLDSLLKKKDDKKDAKNVDNFITDLGGLGTTLPADGAVNPGLRHRPSDQTASSGAPAGGAQPNAGPIPPDSLTPGPTAATTKLPGALPGAPGTAATPGTVTASNASAPTSGISVFGGFGGTTAQPGPVPAAVAQQINNPGQGLPGGMPPGGSTNAQQLIQGLLTSPRPGGLAGLPSAQQGAGQIIGGGIAGVASTYKGTGIKVYNDQEEFPKWEFVYDLSKDKSMNPAAGMPAPAAAPGPRLVHSPRNRELLRALEIWPRR